MNLGRLTRRIYVVLYSQNGDRIVTIDSVTSGGSRIFARGVRQLVPLECPKPLHALSPSDR